MGQGSVLQLIKKVIFQNYSDRSEDPVFRFSRSDIATTLKAEHGVEFYDGILADIDKALSQLYGQGIEPCVGAGRAGALWKFGPGQPPRSRQIPLVCSG